MNSSDIELKALVKSSFTYAVAFYLPLMLFGLPYIAYALLVDQPNTASVNLLIDLVYAGSISPLVRGASAFYAYENINGRGTTVWASLRTAGSKAVRLIAVSLLMFVVLLPALLLLAPGIYLIVRWFFAYYAIMIEDRSALDALRRSWQLTRGRWWMTFKGLVIIPLPVVGLFIIIGALFGFEPAKVGFDLVVFLVEPFIVTCYALIFMVLVHLDADGDETRSLPAG